MKRILKFKLSEELVDSKNNKGKMLYHFIVTNEVDRYSFDNLMIFFESTLTEDEIMNRSYIIGTEYNIKHTIPTSRILDIFTFEDKKILEEYKEFREGAITTKEIQDKRQEDLNWKALSVAKKFREQEIEKLENSLWDINNQIYENEDSMFELERLEERRIEVEHILKQMKDRMY